jgi:uncharacterized membrane protein
MSTFRSLAVAAAAVLSLGLAACGDEGGDPTGSLCAEGATDTWDSFGNQFFAFYCRDCHSNTKSGAERHDAPTDVNFDDLAQVKALTDEIDRWAASGPAATNTDMPPDDPRPSADERAQLGAWLACGAP